jgi:eukaryotic-like serine/threonine-protein kinase
MNHDAPPPAEDTSSTPFDESEVARVFDAYLAGLEAGRAVDPERLLNDHPDIAEPLRACLEVMHLADQMAGGSRSAPDQRCKGANMSFPQAGSGSVVLTTLDLGPGGQPRVHLRDLPEETEPTIKPRSAEMPARNGHGLTRFELQGEIARGGMGVVLKGRDVDLGRDLAIKVLLESYQGNTEVVRRFVEEAQIGGQLQHPGVVPVYELGTFPDRRPFFAMKLIKGRTLASLLQEQTSPAQDLPRFLSIFEAVCQTMAYAHARGVIHRDLKPSNVMVGSFGEVQVMDWGLAKVLPQGGIADEAGSGPAAETVVNTVRSGPAGSGSESLAGSVLGTPAYMAPEQARGELDRIDERADVFGLGAILCEILTGRPPYTGATREEIRARAERGDLADALARIDRSGADAELIGLARDCLAPQPERRPRSAGEVARRMSAYQAGVQERLKAAELARVEAQTRAEEAQARAAIERSRRRRTVALAASVLITAPMIGGGWTYLALQRQERAAWFNRAVSRAEILYAEARRPGDDLGRWLTARDAARALESLLGDAADQPTRRRVRALVRDVTEAATAAENDQKLLNKLVEIRSGKAVDLYGSASDPAYADAFEEAGIDLSSLTPAEAGAKIQARPAAVRVALAAALDDWAAVLSNLRNDRAGAQRLTEAARVADPDPWRNHLRERLRTSQSQDRLTRLRDLARSARADELPAVSLHLLGATLLDLGDPAGAEAILREAQRWYPNDVWLNYTLARCLIRLGRREEAIRYYMAARSLRPETAHELAHVLHEEGETNQAIAIFQDLARLRPEEGWHLTCLSVALRSRGRNQEAEVALDEAIAALRAAIALRPESAQFHFGLGVALYRQGKLDEATTEYHEALRLKPDLVTAHYNLGNTLRDQGKLEEAIKAFREALRLNPDFVPAHYNLGLVLRGPGKLEEAINEFREALRLEPDLPEAHYNLGLALQDQAKVDEAIEEYREALRLEPHFPGAHNALGNALRDRGKRDEAIREYREALRLKPDIAGYHSNLGNALRDQGKLDEAIKEYRKALRLEPDYPEAHNNLGLALHDRRKVDEAIEEYREALRLKPDLVPAHYNLGNALHVQGKPEAAVAEYREAIRLKPDHAEAHYNLGNALRDRGKLEAAIVAYRQAIRLKSDHAEAHCNLGDVLRRQGQFAEALTELKRGHELGSKDPNWRYPSALWVQQAERLVELDAKLPSILSGKLKPSDAAEALGLAQVCYDHKLHGASARFFTEAFQAQPKLADDMQAQNRYNAACAAALAGCGQGKDGLPPDESARAGLRGRALDWLQADLALRRKQLDTDPAAARRALDHWTHDPDLAGVRDADALARLPEAERKGWEALWAEVDVLHKRAQGKTP